MYKDIKQLVHFVQLVGGKDKHFILGHHNHNLPYCLSDDSDTCWHVSFPGNYDIGWNIIFVDIFLPLPVLLKTFEVWKRWRTTNVTAVTLTPRWLEMQCDREISIPIRSGLRIPLWRHPCLLRRQCDNKGELLWFPESIVGYEDPTHTESPSPHWPRLQVNPEALFENWFC